MTRPFNVAETFVDRNVREGRGASPAILCGDEQISYAQLCERVNRAGNALSRLGVRPQERILLLTADCPEFLYCFFGAIKIGAIAVPANPLLKPAEYEYLLNDSEARVAMVSAALLPQIEALQIEGLQNEALQIEAPQIDALQIEALQTKAPPRRRLPHLQKIIVIGQASGQHPTLRRLMALASPELAATPLTEETPAFWLYSSGSTGAPKACIHLHRDMVVCSERYAGGILRMNQHDRCYSVAKLFFAYGLGNAGYFPLYFGGAGILSPQRPTAASVYADIERYRPTLFFSVPSNFATLLAHPRAGKNDFDLSSIRHAVSAGEPLPATLFHRFKERFGIEILDSWGSTETLQMAIANSPGQARAGSSGKIIPGYEARIVGENGADVARGQIGDLWIKGDSLCAGYWKQPEKTAASFHGKWFRTHDKYWQDEDGFFWYSGRADDLFKVNGRWLSPAEVEAALTAHAAVREAAVVARADESGCEKPMAYIVLKDGISADPALAGELQQWVARNIGGYKRPRWIEFVPHLPRTATGKLQRFKLRHHAAQAAGGHSSR